MFKCVWRCYQFIKYMNSASERSDSKSPPKVSLAAAQSLRPHYAFILCHLGTRCFPSLGLGSSTFKMRTFNHEPFQH